MLAGRVAAEAGPAIARARPDVARLPTPHPSPTYVRTSSAVPARIRAALAGAAAILDA